MANLPYVTAVGNVSKALNAIISAATPEAVSGNFVKTMLKIPGGSGDQMTSFLKKIGFANPDGTPTGIYRQFRNDGTRGVAAAESLRFGYAPLYKRNEFLHELSDKDIKGLIVEETGASSDSAVPGLVLSCIKAIRQYADFGTTMSEQPSEEAIPNVPSSFPIPQDFAPTRNGGMASGSIGLSVGYNIHLNLPATTDVTVFNAIFKSLKDHLLTENG